METTVNTILTIAEKSSVELEKCIDYSFTLEIALVCLKEL